MTWMRFSNKHLTTDTVVERKARSVLIITMAFVFLVSFGCGQNKKSLQSNKEDDDTKECVMSFSDGEFVIDGNAHKTPFTLAELVESIGPPDRTAHLANILHTWDRLGIVVYEEGEGAPIGEIRISFQNDMYDFSPKIPFAGTLNYKDIAFNGKSTSADLEAAGLEVDDFSDSSYSVEDGGYTIIADVENGLVSFSINTNVEVPRQKSVFFSNGPVQFLTPAVYEVGSEPDETIVITPCEESGIVLRLNLHNLPKAAAEEFVRAQAKKKGLKSELIGGKTVLQENEEVTVDGKRYEMTFWQVGFGDSLVVLSAEVDPEKKDLLIVKYCLEYIPSLIESMSKNGDTP